MAYIGRQPTVGNFRICDAISVVNGQAAYTMQVGGTNVIPESHNNMIVSLNGVIQKPGSSFTVASSTITFSSNLSTGDVIDFIQILGDVVNIGTPTDGTVTAAKLVDGAVSNAKLANSSITLNSSAVSLGGSHTLANTPAFEAWLSANQSASNDTFTKLQCNTEIYDTDSDYDNSSNYRFTPTTAGKFFIYGQTRVDPGTGNLTRVTLSIYKNGSSYKRNDFFMNTSSQDMTLYHPNILATVDMNGSSDYVELYGRLRTYSGSSISFIGGTAGADTYFGGYKILT